MHLKSGAFVVISFLVLSLATYFNDSQPILSTEKAMPKSIAELGKLLFMDSILSEDYTLSCASCHRPEFAFADTSAFSLGVRGQLGNRNTPSAMNMTERPSFFWDGRAATLEEQALMPIANPVEMNLPVDSAVLRLQNNAFYRQAFLQLFGEIPTRQNLAIALATFERTLETTSAFDRYSMGDSFAISEAALRGQIIFNEKGKCFDCHFGPDLTGDEFRNIGTFDLVQYKDYGRYDATKDSADMGKFKVPGLRNVAVTAPYMHDGSFQTLKEVIEYYNEPDRFVPHAIGRDSLLRQPLNLTTAEMEDLEIFLESMTAPQYLHLLPKRKD